MLSTITSSFSEILAIFWEMSFSIYRLVRDRDCGERERERSFIIVNIFKEDGISVLGWNRWRPTTTAALARHRIKMPRTGVRRRAGSFRWKNRTDMRRARREHVVAYDKCEGYLHENGNMASNFRESCDFVWRIRGCRIMYVYPTLEAEIISKSRWKNEHKHAQDIDSGMNIYSQMYNLKNWNYSEIFQSLLQRENSSIYPREIIIATINKRWIKRLIVARGTNYHKSLQHNGESEHSSGKKNLIENNYPRISPGHEIITMLDYDLAHVRTIQSIEAHRVRRSCREFPLSESQSALDAPTKTIRSLYSLNPLPPPPSRARFRPR